MFTAGTLTTLIVASVLITIGAVALIRGGK